MIATATAATAKQVRFIERLAAERATVEGVSDVLAAVRAQGEALSKREASQVIDALLAIPVPAAAAPAAAAPAKRSNAYPKRCDTCGVRVEAGEGVLAKADDGKWIVTHDGACPSNAFPFPLGRYAVEGEDGALRFYVASLRGLEVQASDDLHRVHPGAEAGIVAKIAADPEGASRAYGQHIGSCGRCGRTLTDAVSRAEGIGPICASKGW